MVPSRSENAIAAVAVVLALLFPAGIAARAGLGRGALIAWVAGAIALVVLVGAIRWAVVRRRSRGGSAAGEVDPTER